MVRLAAHNIRTPVKKEVLKKLRLGDIVYLSGEIFTMRDRGHIRALKEGVPVDIKGGAIYHCGPVLDGKTVVSAGPTTSSRMNAAAPKLIEKFGISAMIGKGGMDDKVSESMRGRCVYLSFVGGCGALAADALEFGSVFWSDLGEPEALWVLNAKRFGPLVVSMDCSGNSIYRNVGEEAKKNLERLEKWE